jgi:hypothetical protein
MTCKPMYDNHVTLLTVPSMSLVLTTSNGVVSAAANAPDTLPHAALW